MSNSKKKKAKVVADIKKNRLYITFDQDVLRSDIEGIYTDIRFCVADLQPGFDVVNDLSNSRLGHLSGIRTFMKITDFLAANQVGKVIRVLGKQSILFKQITKLSRKIEGYKPLYVSTLQDAEELLTSSTPKN